MVRTTVVASKAGTIQCEDDGQSLHSNIVNDLIIGALQEGAVDAYNRTESFRRQTRGEGDGMCFRNADIKEAVRILFLELAQRCPTRHRGGNRTDARIFGREFDHGIGEDILILRWLLDARSCRGADGVAFLDIVDCRIVAFALLRMHMHHNRIVQLFRMLQRLNECRDIVTIYRTGIGEAEFLEEGLMVDELLHRILDALTELHQIATLRQLLDEVGQIVFGAVVVGIGAETIEMSADSANVRRDAHLVVVQYHDQWCIDIAGVVQCLIGHAAGEGTIADDSDRVAAFRLRLELLGDTHSESRRDTGAGVTGTEGIVLALIAAEKAAHSTFLAEDTEAIYPARQHLVGVGLVSYVPNQLVPG